MSIRHVILKMLPAVILMFLAIPASFGQSSDSLKPAKESRHFIFYSTGGDIEVLDSLAAKLEQNYSRITEHLEIQIDQKIKVKVYPDLKSFHAAINYPEAPDWVVGSYNGAELMMVSPQNPGSMHTWQSLMQVVVHEFVHLAVDVARQHKGSAGLPVWLSEGYAQYEAGQVNEKIRKSVASGLMANTPPTWTQLDTVSMMEFGSKNGYALSVTIVEFLVATYGIDKLVLLIKAPETIESIYGLPRDTLEKQWVEYVKNGREE